MVEVRPEIVNVVLQIIDVAASKGAFTGADLTAVGNVREELVKSLSNPKDDFDEVEDFTPAVTKTGASASTKKKVASKK